MGEYDWEGLPVSPFVDFKASIPFLVSLVEQHLDTPQAWTDDENGQGYSEDLINWLMRIQSVNLFGEGGVQKMTLLASASSSSQYTVSSTSMIALDTLNLRLSVTTQANSLLLIGIRLAFFNPSTFDAWGVGLSVNGTSISGNELIHECATNNGGIISGQTIAIPLLLASGSYTIDLAVVKKVGNNGTIRGDILPTLFYAVEVLP